MTAFHTIAIPHDDILQGRILQGRQAFVSRWQREKLLDGFLAGRDRIQDEVEKSGVQRKLWEG